MVALMIVPLGWPGSVLLERDTLTPLVSESDEWGKFVLPGMIRLEQKLLTILYESSIMFLFASERLIAGKKMKKQKVCFV